MKYLRSFNQRLRELRQKKKLTTEDIATFCMVDESVVKGWEAPSDSHRCFPTLDNLLDLCFKTGVALDAFLDFELCGKMTPQLELPGFGVDEEGDLYSAINELNETLDHSLPDERERELLRRFRDCDEERRQFIMQMLPKG
ncbi:helix-turn-helix domain-containing protein [Hahella ganghwensis]|uniref:helix-turn-helix domain-containing protein n=1 Tax=Hahella ganghwensis TaxID=286420 RepID=UPI0003787E07|nr:helix-turn-helix transcriptional regulator [Hahella ganghwensis]